MKFKEINPSPRTLMTPGPVEADPRVLRAMGAHILGQFDPEFTALMNETMEMERYVFQTQNKMTYLVDTTSRGGLETVLTGAICPGDKVLIPAFGRFGYLLAEILERCGADITLLEREWGTVFEPEEIEEALKKDSYKAVAFIHGETSTSMMQPLKEIGEICEKYGALLIVDAVATLGGAEVHVDDWKLSACISGTQKCISAPSGSALITYNEQIEEIVKKRKKVEKGIRTADASDLVLLQHSYRQGTTGYNALLLAEIGGLRASEIAKLKCSDIEITNKVGIIHIVDSKGKRNRDILINNENDIKKLTDMISLCSSGNERFVKCNTKSLHTNISRHMKQIGIRDKYSNQNFHSIRKMWSQKIYDEYRQNHTKAETKSYVSQQLGHGANRDTKTLQRYISNIW